jgi:hypothetical protein
MRSLYTGRATSDGTCVLLALPATLNPIFISLAAFPLCNCKYSKFFRLAYHSFSRELLSFFVIYIDFHTPITVMRHQ